MRKFFRQGLFIVFLCIFVGGINVNAGIICCRKVNNEIIKKTLECFISEKKTLIDSYFRENCPSAIVNIDGSVFEINPKKTSDVLIRIPFFSDKEENIVGDIILDLLLIETGSKDQIISFFTTPDSRAFRFKNITVSPGIGMGDFSKYVYGDIEKMCLPTTEEDTFIYLARNPKAKSVFDAHTLIQEDGMGKIIRKIYF